jgi:hypothetical protein
MQTIPSGHRAAHPPPPRLFVFHSLGGLLLVTVLFPGYCGTNVDDRKSTAKMAKAIKRSPVIQALQLRALFVGGMSRVSSGSIVSDYGLDDRGSIPGRGRGFFL